MLKHANSRLECKNCTLFETKMAKIDTLRLTKTGTMHSLWARKYVYTVTHARDHSPLAPSSPGKRAHEITMNLISRKIDLVLELTGKEQTG